MNWTIIDTDKLRQIDLFEGVSEETLSKVATLIYTRTFKGGQVIFSNGEQDDRMYYIDQGMVRISREVPGFESEILAPFDEGNYFGETALILDAERSADALALTECRLGIIEGSELKTLMNHDLDVAEELLWVFVRTLSQRLRSTNTRMTEVASTNPNG